MAEIPADTSPATAAAQAEISVLRSCRALRLRRLPVLMLHRADHRTGWDGQVWSRLKALRDDGVIGGLGVSAQTPQEALAALDDPDVAHLQLPLNILDGRWDAAGLPERRRSRPDAVLHVRSAFLQGILLRPAADWPRIDGVDPTALLGWIGQQTTRFGRADAADLCLAYLRSLDWIDGIVVGMETLAQLDRNLQLFARPALGADERGRLEIDRPPVQKRLLSPAAWR